MTPDYAQALFGSRAVHVPAWMYVQQQGQENGSEYISFVGASMVPGDHPLRFGSDLTHQLIVGELLVRPHRVRASNVAQGDGLANLITGNRHDEFLEHGVVIL